MLGFILIQTVFADISMERKACHKLKRDLYWCEGYEIINESAEQLGEGQRNMSSKLIIFYLFSEATDEQCAAGMTHVWQLSGHRYKFDIRYILVHQKKNEWDQRQ